MNIALVAHDSRKKELIEWVKYNLPTLSKHKLYATGTTGKLIREAYLDWWEEIENELDVRPYVENWEKHKQEADGLVTCLHSGPLGGDAEIGGMIANGQIDVLIFFCDNLAVQGHQNDIYGLTRLASLYNIAFATNRTTADMILTSPLFKDENYKRILPAAIDNYKNRKV
jgi:methylglyoxal synthase